jgi:hypothetical protein
MESKTSREIKFTETLLEYGLEILVAFATDAENRKLFAIALGQSYELTNPYLIIQINDELARRIKSRSVDALSAILTPLTNEWLIVDFATEIGEIVKTYTNAEELPREYLPGPDLFV